MSVLPYTHQLHASRCREAAQARHMLVQYVQSKRQGVTYCARISEAWTTPDGLDMWVLDLLSPEIARRHVPAKSVTQCSGVDGHCVCAGETS